MVCILCLRVTPVLKVSQGKTARQEYVVSLVKEAFLEPRYNQHICQACGWNFCLESWAIKELYLNLALLFSQYISNLPAFVDFRKHFLSSPFCQAHIVSLWPIYMYSISLSFHFYQGAPGLKGGEGPQGPQGPVVSMVIIDGHAFHRCKLQLFYHYSHAEIPWCAEEKINMCQSKLSMPGFLLIAGTNECRSTRV